MEFTFVELMTVVVFNVEFVIFELMQLESSSTDSIIVQLTSVELIFVELIRLD